MRLTWLIRGWYEAVWHMSKKLRRAHIEMPINNSD